jgi:hypothetical protein
MSTATYLDQSGNPIPARANKKQLSTPVTWVDDPKYAYTGEQPIIPVRPSEQYLDPDTGEPMGVPKITPDQGADMFKAVVHAQMTGTTPGDAYLNREAFDTELKERGGDDYDKGVGYAIKTGFESTPLGLLIRGKAPDPFESHDHLGNFIHDVSEMVSDPLMLASAFTSEAGVGIAGFAADAAANYRSHRPARRNTLTAKLERRHAVSLPDRSHDR